MFCLIEFTCEQASTWIPSTPTDVEERGKEHLTSGNLAMDGWTHIHVHTHIPFAPCSCVSPMNGLSCPFIWFLYPSLLTIGTSIQRPSHPLLPPSFPPVPVFLCVYLKVQLLKRWARISHSDSQDTKKPNDPRDGERERERERERVIHSLLPIAILSPLTFTFITVRNKWQQLFTSSVQQSMLVTREGRMRETESQGTENTKRSISTLAREREREICLTLVLCVTCKFKELAFTEVKSESWTPPVFICDSVLSVVSSLSFSSSLSLSFAPGSSFWALFYSHFSTLYLWCRAVASAPTLIFFFWPSFSTEISFSVCESSVSVSLLPLSCNWKAHQLTRNLLLLLPPKSALATGCAVVELDYLLEKKWKSTQVTFYGDILCLHPFLSHRMYISTFSLFTKMTRMYRGRIFYSSVTVKFWKSDFGARIFFFILLPNYHCQLCTCGVGQVLLGHLCVQRLPKGIKELRTPFSLGENILTSTLAHGWSSCLSFSLLISLSLLKEFFRGYNLVTEWTFTFWYAWLAFGLGRTTATRTTYYTSSWGDADALLHLYVYERRRRWRRKKLFSSFNCWGVYFCYAYLYLLATGWFKCSSSSFPSSPSGPELKFFKTQTHDERPGNRDDDIH